MGYKQQVHVIVMASLVLAFLAGRGSEACANPLYKETEVKDGGTIRGVVRCIGNALKAPKMDITKDTDYCGRTAVCPPLRLGAKSGVQDAVVYLEGVERGKKFSASSTVVINQRRCNYEPHVTILPMGRELEIVNSDPILHNVHAYDMYGGLKTIFNIAQPVKGQRTPVKSSQSLKPGTIVATCDAGHPWMTSYIVVADHPYYAVTDANGNFALENVPPGTYKIKMWHEGVEITKTEVENGKVKKYYFEDPYITEKEITVPADGNTTVNFELSLR